MVRNIASAPTGKEAAISSSSVLCTAMCCPSDSETARAFALAEHDVVPG